MHLLSIRVLACILPSLRLHALACLNTNKKKQVERGRERERERESERERERKRERRARAYKNDVLRMRPFLTILHRLQL